MASSPTTDRSERIMAAVLVSVFALIVGSYLVEASTSDGMPDFERYRACEELPRSVSISCMGSAP